jgi:hypothetical protein
VRAAEGLGREDAATADATKALLHAFLLRYGRVSDKALQVKQVL